MCNKSVLWRWLVGFVLLFSGVTGTAFAQKQLQTPPAPKPFSSNWLMVAESDFVVRAQLSVPVQDVKKWSSPKRQDGEYVTLSLGNPQFLKGKSVSGPLKARFYVSPIPPRQKIPQDYLTPQKLIALNGKKVIAFLVYSDDGRLYLAEGSVLALQADKTAIANVLQKEALNQTRIVGQFAQLSAGKPDALHNQVKGLIEKMTDAQTQADAFAQLEALGKKGVPSTIRLMDDRRPLGREYIMLKNDSPDAFEAYRQYGPHVVVDALAAILNQVVGLDFGFIMNGGTEIQRKKAIAGWRVYLFYRPTSPKEIALDSR